MRDPKFSLVLIGLGIVLLGCGIALEVVQSQRATANKPVELKEHTIPLSVDDFSGEDPRLQAAIQQQLQQQQGTPQKTGESKAGGGDVQLLQPAPTDLQGSDQ